MGVGKEENAIVTSTGQYVVAWDFGKVKKGQLDKYEIKKCVCVRGAPPRAPRLARARLTAPPSFQVRPVRRARQLQVRRRQGDRTCHFPVPPPFSPLGTRRASHEKFACPVQIVALQNDVLAINKKNLRKPTRASLAVGGRSRSSIVDSPY